MKTSEKLLLVMEMITQLIVYYVYFKNYYKVIATDLSKKQAYYADPRAIQEINFTANSDRERNTIYISFLKK